MEIFLLSNQQNLIAFDGTLQFHQVHVSAFMPPKLQMKSFSRFRYEGIMCLLDYRADSQQIFIDVYESESKSRNQPDDISVASDLTSSLENLEISTSISV